MLGLSQSTRLLNWFWRFSNLPRMRFQAPGDRVSLSWWFDLDGGEAGLADVQCHWFGGQAEARGAMFGSGRSLQWNSHWQRWHDLQCRRRFKASRQCWHWCHREGCQCSGWVCESSSWEREADLQSRWEGGIKWIKWQATASHCETIADLRHQVGSNELDRRRSDPDHGAFCLGYQVRWLQQPCYSTRAHHSPHLGADRV